MHIPRFSFLLLILLSASFMLAQDEGEIVITDGVRHNVPLEEIIFDDFDNPGNRALPYTFASEADIERLRDRIVPLCYDNSACITPSYQSAEEAAQEWLGEGKLVIGYVANDGQAYAYPFNILNFHEIVNETLAGASVLISYCPLCNSAMVHSRIVDEQELSFGNTSALYESDMVMYDFETGSYWNQAGGRSILGELTSSEMELLPSTITTFGQWRSDHPETQVLACPRSCSQYAADVFASYETFVRQGRFFFPVSRRVVADDRLELNTDVLVIDGEEASVAYPLAELGNSATIDEIDGDEIVILSLERGPAGAAFFTGLPGGDIVNLEFDNGVWRDTKTDSIFNLSGLALSGELQGQQLEQVPSRYLFWFSAVATTPNIEVFGQDE